LIVAAQSDIHFDDIGTLFESQFERLDGVFGSQSWYATVPDQGCYSGALSFGESAKVCLHNLP
jgi:hypothetical protein